MQVVLDHLLNIKNYLEFFKELAYGNPPLEEWENAFRALEKDRETFARTMIKIARILYKKHYTVLYPLEMIVVPRYPFTKVPMVKWLDLKRKDYSDPTVVEIKDVAGRLGNLINAGFILRNFVLIDMDTYDESLCKEFDVKTRRGCHKLFYIPNYQAVAIGFGEKETTKYRFKAGEIEFEFMSGNNYLGSHPLQSRYIEVASGKINIRSYKFLSREAEIAFRSADLTPIKANIHDVREFLCFLFKETGRPGYCNSMILKPMEREEISVSADTVQIPRNRFQSVSIPVLGTLRYSEFKEILYERLSALPVCIEKALFEPIPRGHRWFHLRLLLAVVPFFVFLNTTELEEMIADFAARTASTGGEIRKWMYDAKYFTGKLNFGEREINVPSALGVPEEAWKDFRALGYCDTCGYREQCLYKESRERRKLIINVLNTLIMEQLGEEE